MAAFKAPRICSFGLVRHHAAAALFYAFERTNTSRLQNFRDLCGLDCHLNVILSCIGGYIAVEARVWTGNIMYFGPVRHDLPFGVDHARRSR